MANLYGNNVEIKEKASKYIPQLAVGVGTLKYRDGNTEEAMKMFDLTLSYEPNNGKAYLGKGLIYNDQEEIKKMIENLEKAIELSAACDAKTADLARQTIAKYYVKTGDSELEALDPAEEDFSYIMEQYEQALGYDPSNADAHYKLAVINNRMVEYDKAVLHCKKALETETNDVKIAAIHFELGNAYVGNAEYAMACESFNKAMVGIFEERAAAKKKNVPGCN
jgi:tetratricopeptide (TPR) repeat protein